MRPDSTGKHVISVEKQVMHGDCCANPFVFREDKLHSLLSRDMLEHNFQLWQSRPQWAKNLINEALFPVKNINLMVGYFSMYKQRNFKIGHRFEHRHDFIYRSYATV